MPNTTTQREWDIMEIEAVLNRVKAGQLHLVSRESAINAFYRLMDECELEAERDIS